jgi:NAD(P)H-hydrate epimerase
LVQKLLQGASGRWLIDADGLNAIASLGPRILRKSKADILLTPHAGEFSRLTGAPTAEIESHRIDAARAFARTFGVGVVLKGVPTATAARNGDVFLNPTGNPGMATAGSGDVLAGLMAGCWAQGMTMIESAWAGAYLHGLSGDSASEKIGERSLIAGDLIDFLPEAIRRVELGETA